MSGLFGLTQEYVPSENEVPAEHWSKSPEYLAEKATQQHPGQGFVASSTVVPASRTRTTHDIMKDNFTVEYVKSEEELAAELKQRELEIRADINAQADVYEKLAIDMLVNVEKALKEKDAQAG